MNEAIKRVRPAALAVLVLALPLLAACNKAGGGAGSTKEEAAHADLDEAHEAGGLLKLSSEEAGRAGLELETLRATIHGATVAVTATIRANQDRFAHVAPPVEGRVVQAVAKLGERVRPGQVLAVLDSVSLGEARAAYQQARSEQRVAAADLARAKALADEEIIPRRELLRSQAELEKAQATLRAARDKLALLGAPAEAGEGVGARLTLRAPLAGTVIDKAATVGELAGPSQPLFTVADLSSVWIDAHLTEDVLAQVNVGAPATVTVSAYPQERFAGKVSYVAGVLDKGNRTVTARIEVANPQGRLKPEMFASAAIETGVSAAPALSVPAGAVVMLQGQPIVFVREKEGFEPRPVQTGDTRGGRTVLASGVREGEEVVTGGVYALKARLLKSQISDEH